MTKNKLKLFLFILSFVFFMLYNTTAIPQSRDVRDPDGNLIEKWYRQGNKVEIRDPNGNLIQRRIQTGNKIEIRDPDGSLIRIEREN